MLKTTPKSDSFLAYTAATLAGGPFGLVGLYVYNKAKPLSPPSANPLTGDEWNQFIALAHDSISLQHRLFELNLPSNIFQQGKGWTTQLGEKELFLHVEGNSWEIYMQDSNRNTVSLAKQSPPYLPVFGNAQNDVWNYIRQTSLGLYHHSNAIRQYLNTLAINPVQDRSLEIANSDSDLSL